MKTKNPKNKKDEKIVEVEFNHLELCQLNPHRVRENKKKYRRNSKRNKDWRNF